MKNTFLRKTYFSKVVSSIANSSTTINATEKNKNNMPWFALTFATNYLIRYK